MEKQKKQERAYVFTPETTEMLYQLVLLRNGITMQSVVAIEEMSELQKELCKLLRFKNDGEWICHVAEEIADVEIMIEQMKLAFLCEKQVKEWREKKLQRLAEWALGTKEANVDDG